MPSAINQYLLFGKPALVTTACLYWAILFFSLMSLVLAVSTLYMILRKHKLLKKRRAISNQMEEWLMNLILENDGLDEKPFSVPADINVLLQNKLAQKVLVRELVKAKKSLSGASGRNLEKIYDQLNLQEVSMQRINSKPWHIKSKGIQELAMMNRQGSSGLLSSLTNHADAMVRMEAQTAMVRLQGYEGLKFFDTVSYPLSEWHQLNLLHLLGHQPISGGKGIFNWLSSANDSVVQFSLKLISEQHAAAFHDDVVKCLDHSNPAVRREAISCLGQMGASPAISQLDARFANEPDKNVQLCIIHQYVNAGSGEDLPFLQSLQYAEDNDIKLAANKTVLYLQKNF